MEPGSNIIFTSRGAGLFWLSLSFWVGIIMLDVDAFDKKAGKCGDIKVNEVSDISFLIPPVDPATINTIYQISLSQAGEVLKWSFLSKPNPFHLSIFDLIMYGDGAQKLFSCKKFPIERINAKNYCSNNLYGAFSLCYHLSHFSDVGIGIFRMLNERIKSRIIIADFTRFSNSFQFNISNWEAIDKAQVAGDPPPTNPVHSPNFALLFLLIATWVIIITFLIISKNGKGTLLLLKRKNAEIVEQKEELEATLNMVEHLNAKLDSQNQALNSSALVAILKSDGRIDSINEVFTSLTGYTNADLINTNFKNLISHHQKELFQQQILETIRVGENWRGELCQFKKNEACVWLDSVFVPLKTDREEKDIYVVQFDITERIHAEEKLIEQNKNLKHANQLKNKLFSIVSHDFRSPLKSLQGTLTLLNKGAVTAEELKTLSGNLLNKVENTTTFLENILNWAKSQMQGVKLKPQILNINKITSELIKLLKPQADKKFIEVINEVNEGIDVVADLEMIKLVLRNLISNALKFSYEQGKVEISAEIQNETAIISVTDHGTGIEEEHLESIFKLENYSKEGTANETGAGLGLILCKDFVEQNNGKIWVTSKIDKGSTFSFSLPIVENLSEPEFIKKA